MTSKITAVLDRIEAQQAEEEIEVGPSEDSLDFLRKVYRSTRQPMSRRLRAAIEAAPMERPRMTAVSVGYFSGDDFGSRLERAIERSNRARLIEGRVVEDDSRE
jgi:allophanate hydrolase subunit 1